MLTHSEDDSFLQISQEIGDEERCGYFHCPFLKKRAFLENFEFS
ncbi:hypothetical protein T4B_4860 [Trichinella pseudospiralis]|uniref:Uncharacterized protein n=1 Tax=Trichinella pseudospiralis TaxID=6337 RepID=A0A0V1G8P6_TRIPS|nr:hypothetical protein T4B_4860 [Trichinella pseudospiralis]KRY98589.1 hypothetical protein T4C_168 [Trichinella pseudospiralis]